MTKRKSKSPREILSLFDEAAHAKKGDDQSSRSVFSVLDTTPLREESTAQEPAHEPERADYAPSQPPVPGPQTSPTPRPQQPSWTRAEAAKSKQLEADIATEASHSQGLRQQMQEQTKNKFFAAKPGVSTTRQKTIMILVPILLAVLIFVLIRVSLAPTVAGGGNLIVKGILYNEDNPSAIVNNQIVYEGDKISGAAIIKINRGSVKFEVKKRWPIKSQRFTKKVRR